jgi:hypothetical protein
LKNKKKSCCRTESIYFWNDKEQQRYINFLAERRSILELPPNQRKHKKIHQKMSTAINSRNSLQCRSHHQKMLKKYGSISGILEEFKALIKRSNLLKLMSL